MESNILATPNYLLRQAARDQLKGKWGRAVLLCFLFSLLSQAGAIIPFVGTILPLILAGPFMLGAYGSFVRLKRGEAFELEGLFDGFKNFSKAFVLYLLTFVFTLLWSLLLIVPGIIAIYRYSMAFYILYDNPGMTASEALNDSKQMMVGYKWKLFCLHLSFIGWILLSLLTLGIGMLWVTPYMLSAQANFYEDLKELQTPAEPPVFEPTI